MKVFVSAKAGEKNVKTISAIINDTGFFIIYTSNTKPRSLLRNGASIR
jgi:predicted ATPase